MRKVALLTTFLVAVCFIDEVAANPNISNEIVGAYAGVGTNFQNSGSFNFGFKVRYLKHCPFGFEFVDMIPFGTEIAFPLYLIHHKYFKLHVILPFTGFHIPWMKKRMAVDWVKRKETVDLVVGLGAEVQLETRGLLKTAGFRYFSINLDWRMIAPSPTWVLKIFGDYGRAIYKQSAKEGQLWLGITFWY